MLPNKHMQLDNRSLSKSESRGSLIARVNSIESTIHSVYVHFFSAIASRLRHQEHSFSNELSCYLSALIFYHWCVTTVETRNYRWSEVVEATLCATN